MNLAVKFVAPNVIEGLAFPFSTDLDDERFTADTDLCVEWFGKGGRPVIYDHGMDKAMKTVVVGRQDDFEVRDEGIWAQATLDKHAQYRKAIDSLIEQGAIGYSSGAMAHLATKSVNGDITRWPWVELSLTPTPANPETLGVHYLKSVDRSGSLPVGESYATHIDRVLDEVMALSGRTRSISEIRAKSGRVLSAANRERIAALVAAWEPSLADLKAFLAETDPEAQKSLDAAIWDALRTQARLAGVPVG